LSNELDKSLIFEENVSFRFTVANLPEFFTKRQQLGPKSPDPGDLEVREKKTRKHKTTSAGNDDVRSPEEVAEEARYRSVHHLIKLINLIVTNFEGDIMMTLIILLLSVPLI
jgi:hypothetical protein